MIEKTEQERQVNVNRAISEGLLSVSVVEMVDEFTRRNNFARSSFVDGVANPGPKSAKSLVSKLHRRHDLEGDDSFVLTDVTDIIRCSIMVDNFEQSVALIKELKKRIPGLSGSVSENNTGYKGIHILFSINGYKAELQISTRDAWYVKQAGEEVYAKWRDFNTDAKLREIYDAKDGPMKDQLIAQFLADVELMNSHNLQCRKMFDALHEHTDFEKWKEAVNAELFLNDGITPDDLPSDDLIKYNVKADGTLDDDELKAICQEYSNSAIESQNILIGIATESLTIAKSTTNGNTMDILSKEEKAFILFKRDYSKMLIERCDEQFGDRYDYRDFIGNINWISSCCAAETVKYCQSNGITLTKENFRDVMVKANGVNENRNLILKGEEKLYRKVEATIERSLTLGGLKKSTTNR